MLKRFVMCGVAAAAMASALAAPADASPFQSGGRRYLPPAIRIDPTPYHPSREYPKPTISLKATHSVGYKVQGRK
jgi:hypothetical protein